MKIWITKYALSEGIWWGEVEETDVQGSMIECLEPNTKDGPKKLIFGYFHGLGREWHKSESEAKAKAYKMRDAKIKSLEKNIEKLKKMEF